MPGALAAPAASVPSAAGCLGLLCVEVGTDTAAFGCWQRSDTGSEGLGYSQEALGEERLH